MRTLIVLFAMFIFAGIVYSQTADNPDAILGLPVILTTILGFVAPVLVQLVAKLTNNEWIRFLIAIGLSGIVGFVAMLLLGMKVWQDPNMISTFIVLASLSYKLFWKPIWKKNGSILNAPATVYPK